MTARLFGVSVASVIALVCMSAVALEQGKPEASTATAPACQRLVIVEDDQPVKVEVGEIVRVEGSGPSGMVEITAKTEGPVKLARTNDVRRVANGHTLIGAMTREFEVKAQGKGTAKIVVTVNNKIAKKIDTKEFKIEIR